jgi:hypothetical protein
MKKLTINFDVKGYDLFLTTFEKGKLDATEVQSKADAGEYPFDYWETPFMDYEFFHDDMGNTQIGGFQEGLLRMACGVVRVHPRRSSRRRDSISKSISTPIQRVVLGQHGRKWGAMVFHPRMLYARITVFQ